MTFKEYIQQINAKYQDMAEKINGAFTIGDAKKMAIDLYNAKIGSGLEIEDDTFYTATMSLTQVTTAIGTKYVAELNDDKLTGDYLIVIYPKTYNDRAKINLYLNANKNPECQEGKVKLIFDTDLNGETLSIDYKIYRDTGVGKNAYIELPNPFNYSNYTIGGE